MTSIRLFLTMSVISIVILANFLAAVKGYQSSMQKAEEIFDAKMLHTAKILLSFIPSKDLNTENTSTYLNRINQFNNNDNNNDEILYIIKNDDGLIISKSSIIDTLPKIIEQTSDTYFNWVNFKNYRWRQLNYFDSERSLEIIFMEKQTDRFLLAETVILESIYPILLAIPSIALVVFFIIGRGLKPLFELTSQLRDKKSNNLSPITLKNVPKELTELKKSLNNLLSRLDGAIIREKRFSADAAHELRTPITALSLQMVNLIHDIKSVKSDDTQKSKPVSVVLPDSINDLSSGIQRMSHLVEQILTLNQISVDDYCDNFNPVNLTTILRQTIAEIYPLIENKNQNIALEFESANTSESKLKSESHYFVDGDEHGLICLFTNLLENANKYTPNNGDIKVIIRYCKDSVIVSVIDSGQGISEQDKERIFDRFYRAGGDSHQSKESGCGLGLSIVQEISSRHNALIELYSHKLQDDSNLTALKELFNIDFQIGLWLDIKFKLIS